MFPVSTEDTRLARKERVLGVIIDGSAKAYRFGDFDNGIVPVVLQDSFLGEDLVIVGNKIKNYLIAFGSKLPDGTQLTFSAYDDDVTNTSEVMMDNEGNVWNIFGEAVSGPRIGTKLESTVSYIGYFFAWGTFYPNLEIHNF